MKDAKSFVKTALENNGYTGNEIQVATFTGYQGDTNCELIFEITFIDSEGDEDHANVYINWDASRNHFKADF